MAVPSPDLGAPDLGPPRELRWSELGAASATRPAARFNHFAAYDSTNDRLLVLGGFDPYLPQGGCCTNPYQYFKDVWQLDLKSESWSRLGEMSQPVLDGGVADVAFDEPSRRLVLIGARSNANFGSPQSYSLDIATLKLTALPAGPWGGESPLRSAFDRTNRRVVVHGAYSTQNTEGTWSLSLANNQWTTLPSVKPPPFRYHAPLAGISAGRALLYAGFTGEGAAQDLWELNTSSGSWRELSLVNRPLGRWEHRTVYDPQRALLVIFGGERWGATSLGTLIVDMNSLAVQEPELSPAPASRRAHTMVLDTKRRRAIVHGGAYDSKHAYADTWALQLP